MEEFYQHIDYTFSKPSILKLALSHCSAGRDNNERLEFLGDSILGFIIADALYQRFPGASEGELSRLRADLVQKSTLAEIAAELHLGTHLILGLGEAKSGGAKRPSILADALEALITAIYLDSSLDVCREKVLQWFSVRLAALNLQNPIKDAKTRLQEFLQRKKMPLPVYEVASIEGKDHQQVFSVKCRVKTLKESVMGKGKSRREAEQAAAESSLLKLGVADE